MKHSMGRGRNTLCECERGSLCQKKQPIGIRYTSNTSSPTDLLVFMIKKKEKEKKKKKYLSIAKDSKESKSLVTLFCYLSYSPLFCSIL